VDDLRPRHVADQFLKRGRHAEERQPKALRGLLDVEHRGLVGGIALHQILPLLVGQFAAGELAQVEETGHPAGLSETGIGHYRSGERAHDCRSNE
jgi:hypothetical protein